jgi:hypothetical protein
MLLTLTPLHIRGYKGNQSKTKIKNCKALSIMYDGATNSSVSQVEIIYCRSLENGYPKYYYVGQEDLE